MCFLLASTIPFFVALLFCRLCKFIELLEIFNFYRILLLETCARFLSFLPCIFIVIASFYRFSLVLSFWSRFISVCVLIFSLFFVPFRVFFERCGGKLSVNRFYSIKIDISAAM